MFTAIFLLIIGTVLILFNINAIKKEGNDFQKIFHEKEKNISDYDLEIGKMRKEFAETLVEIQSQMVKLEEVINSKSDKSIEKSIEEPIHKTMKNEKNSRENKVLDKDIKYNDDKNKVEIKRKDDFKKNKKTPELHKKTDINNVKVNEIQHLIEKGLSVDEIANKLKVNKGEILLVKELYLK